MIQLNTLFAKVRTIQYSPALLLCILLSIFAVTSPLAQRPTDRAMPVLTGPVYDEANLLTPGEKAQLETKLRRFEDSTSTQIAVVILDQLGEREISDYA